MLPSGTLYQRNTPLSALYPVIHIGPPKTASTTLQTDLVPFLGRPYQVKPDWARALARGQPFSIAPLPPDILISDEILADFAVLTPQLVADQLARVIDGGVVIYVKRDRTQLFYSLYRQHLVNGISKMPRQFRETGKVALPVHAAEFCRRFRDEFNRQGTGFFAMADVELVAKSFGRHFDFAVIDFGLMRTGELAREFCRLCGAPYPDKPLGRENPASPERIREAFAETGIGGEKAQTLIDAYLAAYAAASAPDRPSLEELLREIANSREV